MVNATADRATRRGRPVAAAKTCSIPPIAVPKQEAKPSARPPATVRATTYAMPGPGVMARARAATRNVRKDIGRLAGCYSNALSIASAKAT